MPAPGQPRPWSLARRLTLLFVLTTALFVLAISATSAWFLRRSLDSEIDSLVREELDEMQMAFDHGVPPLQELEELVARFGRDHKDCKFSWRIWEPQTLWTVQGIAPWHELGDVEELGPEAPAPVPVERNVELSGGRIWRTEAAGDGWRIGLLLDGSERFKVLRQYLIWASSLLLASLALTLGFARYFFLRVSGLLREVAEGARDLRRHEAADPVDVAGGPLEIHEIASALSETFGKLRAETRQARVFTAGLAHELRSPVQNLVGETEVALLRERDPEAYRKVLLSNLEELRALGDAVDNLVTICSAGEQREALSRELVDLGAEARLRLAREHAQGARHGVALELEIQGDTRLWGDREALLRATRNLVANAIQWSPAGSRVRARITGSLREVEILVEDAGPGVPPELRERIFEPFFRGPQSSGRRIGYGLGLALTRMAVDEHHGTIEVGASELGGARFLVRLPKRGEQPEASDDRSTGLTS